MIAPGVSGVECAIQCACPLRGLDDVTLLSTFQRGFDGPYRGSYNRL